MSRESFPKFPEIPQDDREKELTTNPQPPEEIPQPEKENQAQELGDKIILPESPEDKTKSEEEKIEEAGITEKLLRGMNNKTVKRMVATIAFAAAMGGAGKFAESGQKGSTALSPDKKAEKTETQTAEANLPLTMSGRQREHPGHIESHGIDHTFLKRGNDGELKFNWWSLLAPIQWEVGMRNLVEKDASFEVPQHYARLFSQDAKAGHPLRQEDYNKIERYVEQQLKRQFAETLHGLDTSKNIHQLHHQEEKPEVHDLKIKNIRIKGFASPEGPQSLGEQTIVPGNKEAENMELGKTRAQSAKKTLESGLKEMGIKGKKGEEVARALYENKISQDELQFNRDEMRELAKIAEDQGSLGVDDTEKIYNLIIDYNEGRIKDAKANGQLDKIIAGKRKVEIEIDYEGQQARKILIPIPLIPLALLGAYMALRRRPRDGAGGGADRGSIRPMPESQPAAPQPESKPLVKAPPIKYQPKYGLDEISKNNMVEFVNLPPRESDRYAKMEEAALIDNLYAHFDRQDTKDGGLDYRKIANEFEAEYDRYQSDWDSERAITDILLDQWREYDIKQRRAAGVAEDQLEVGLDYGNKKEQVEQALMHARIILDMVKERKFNKGDYMDILGKKTQQAIRRRTFRDK